MSREQHFTLSTLEKTLLQQLAEPYGCDIGIYSGANKIAARLSSKINKIFPGDLLAAIKLMKQGLGPELITISNLPYDKNIAWEEELNTRVAKKTRISEICLLGINGLLGGTLQEETSSHQQGFIHQVTPVANFLVEASGRGGGAIPFHAENMFIKNSPGFLSLFCLQGEKGVETEYLYVDDIVKHLDEKTVTALKKPLYTITSGDGFSKKQLSASPVIDAFESGWIACRFYEEDRLFSSNIEGQLAIENLHLAIKKAREIDTQSIELSSGTLLLFSNAVRKHTLGGVLHGRRGNMKTKVLSSKTPSTKSPYPKTMGQRWLQRICIGLSY